MTAPNPTGHPLIEAEKKVPHPLAWVPTLYAAESLPYSAVLLVSVLMYRDLRSQHPSLTDGNIAFYTAWLALPWSLKPFWSPFLEQFRSKKSIVLAMQIIGGALFGCIALTISTSLVVQASLALFFILAFGSATHDIAADGVYMDSLTIEKQSLFTGVQSAFWNIGQLLAKGALVYLAGALSKSLGIRPGWMIVFGVFALLMFGLAMYHGAILPKGKPGAGSSKSGGKGFSHIVKAFFLKENLVWMVVFVLLYRFAESQVTKIAPLFLRAEPEAGGLGLSTGDVGVIYGVFATGANVLGSLAGGAFAKSIGIRKALLPLSLIFNLPNLLFTVLAFWRPESLVIIGIFASFEQFTLGFGMVAIILFMMQQLAPGKFRMAHYGFATALMNIGVMVPGMMSGQISDAISYKWFFVYVLVAAIPSIAVASLVPFRTISEDNPEEDPDRSTRHPTMLAPILLGLAILALVGWSMYRQVKSSQVAQATADRIEATAKASGHEKSASGVLGDGFAFNNVARPEFELDSGKCYTVVGKNLSKQLVSLALLDDKKRPVNPGWAKATSQEDFVVGLGNECFTAPAGKDNKASLRLEIRVAEPGKGAVDLRIYEAKK
jgi:MFS transporter, PAT family, beta-lactamase induction signal transducer AmpG